MVSFIPVRVIISLIILFILAAAAFSLRISSSNAVNGSQSNVVVSGNSLE